MDHGSDGKCYVCLASSRPGEEWCTGVLRCGRFESRACALRTMHKRDHLVRWWLEVGWFKPRSTYCMVGNYQAIFDLEGGIVERKEDRSVHFRITSWISCSTSVTHMEREKEVFVNMRPTWPWEK